MFKFVKRLFLAIIFLSFFTFIFSLGRVPKKEDLKYGVTFSHKQAIDLGLDWKQVFLDMLNDLEVKKLRLSAYWDDVERDDDYYRFDNIDWQIKEATKSGAEIILAVGGRLPRWPECHFPDWVKDLSQQDRQEKQLEYIEKVVERYKENENIIAWQVENEPFLKYFGICEPLDKDFLDEEIALVRKLDDRQIVVTDSGELSIWVPAAKRADIFGTTMYRDTYSENLKKYIHYPITPSFFKIKKNLARLFSHPKKWIVIELQAEPWAPEPFQNVTSEEREKTMNLEKFKEMIEFSSKTGFDEFYLWGVEWWYWEKETQNNPSLWDEAKKLYKTR